MTENWVWKNIDALHPWADNYNQGDVGAIALSIQEYGLNKTIAVWQGDEVRAGNHTLLALRALHTQGPQKGKAYPPDNVRVVEGEWWIQCADISHMSENRATAYAIADNRTAQLASQDDGLLLQYLQGVKADEDLLFEATGYDDEELTRLLTEPDFKEYDESIVDTVQYHECPNCGHKFPK